MMNMDMMGWWMIIPMLLGAVVFSLLIFGLIRLLTRWANNRKK